METFIVTQNGGVIHISEDLESAKQLVEQVYEEYLTGFSSQPEYNRTYYTDARNYASQFIRTVKVFQIREGGVFRLPVNWQWNNRDNMPEGVVDITDQVYTVEETQFEGALKVFATVTKRGIKSSGMSVLIDPHLHGGQIRPVEEYEALIGTFAKIKATTHISGYGYTVLFFAPESLGDFRIETQMISGLLTTFR